MKSLLNGCAVAVLLVGMAGQAHAAVEVHDAPIYGVPSQDDDDAPPPRPAMPDAPQAPKAAAPAPANEIAAPTAEAPQPQPAKVTRAEPTVVRALMEQKPTPPVPALTPEEEAFFTVLGKRVTDAASAYEAYVRRAGGIDGRVGDAAQVHRVLQLGSAYQPQQLQEGIVAYAALLALRNDAFVESVKSLRDPSFGDRLAAAPGLVMQIRGADEAASDVAGALHAQGAALLAAGKAVTQAAYDVQSQSWSKTPVSDPGSVLAEAKDAAAQPRTASMPAKARLLASLVAAPQTPTTMAAGAPDVVRGLALAALAIMGRTGDDKEAAFEALLHDASSVDCLKMAKMNLNQCLAVAGPHYEDLYCTGRHAVSDTAKCLTAAADGATTPLEPPAPQRADGYGPEQARAYGRPGLQPEDREDDDSAPTPAPRYAAAAPPAYGAQAYAPAPQPSAPPAPQAYARNETRYNPPAYAPAQPQYPAQAYAPQPQPYAQPPRYQPAPQPSYQGQQQPYPYSPYPYGYAARGYYGQ